MALSAAHANYVRRLQNLSRVVLDITGEIQQSQVLGNGTPNYLGAITQLDLDESFPDSGATTATLADVQYVLSLIEGNINNQMVGLSIMANIP